MHNHSHCVDHHNLLSNELMSAEAIGLITGAVKLFPDHPIIIASVLDILASVSCTGEGSDELCNLVVDVVV